MKIVAAALIGLNWAMAHAQVTRCPNTCEQVLGALATEGDAT